MLAPHIFKAYDIRGKYPAEINEGVVETIVSFLAPYFPKGTLVIGHDARVSSLVLYHTALLAARFLQVTTLPVGMITTPMLYFLVNHLKAAGGIMVTASHNPKEYNGLKIVGPKAAPISGYEIYQRITDAP